MAHAQAAVIFSHGQESGPWGTKISRLAPLASACGMHVESVDYRGIADPDARVALLLSRDLDRYQPLILVGSSMGGYVAAVAAQNLRPRGLFLMAPALYLPGYANQNPQPHADVMVVIHGWRDELIPPEHSIRFARDHRAALHVIDSDHTLNDQLSLLEQLFSMLLDRAVAE